MMMTFADGITGFFWSLMMIVGMTLPILLMIWALSAVGERVAERKTSGSTRLDKGEITVDDFQRLKEPIT